jgi:hypothetical protein
MLLSQWKSENNNPSVKFFIQEQRRKAKIKVDMDESTLNSFTYGNNVTSILQREDFQT